MVHITCSKPPRGYMPQLDDIVFTHADASWVHHPHEDSLVITIEVANSVVHWLLVDNGSVVNILYWDAYQKTGLRRANLTPTISPLYGFTRDSVIPERTIKLVVTLGEPPWMATVMIDFLIVKCSSAFNGVLGIPLLRTMKVVMSIHCLKIKFPTAVGIGQVWGWRCDSRECYNRSLELAEMAPELPQAIDVEKTSRRLMETDIDPQPTRRWINRKARGKTNWDPSGPQRT